MCISAPIDYKRNHPFVRCILIDYFSDQTDFPPQIGEIFNLTVAIENLGPVIIPDLNISMFDQFGDLRRVDHNNLNFYNITNTIFFNITLKKNDWKGYYYPPINYFKSSESKTIQIYSSSSIVIGYIGLSLNKSVNKVDIEIGDKILVELTIKNIGNICIKNLLINDMLSYSQSDFLLVEGKLVNVISCIKPGEIKFFNYTIKAKKQGIFSLKPASISYYYLIKQEERSNEIRLKIIKPQIKQLYYVIIPSIFVLVIFGIYSWQIKKYKLKRQEFQRSETKLFKLSSRDSILKIEDTLRERLKIISKKDDPNFSKGSLNQLTQFNEERDD